jgi:hypothetical protein
MVNLREGGGEGGKGLCTIELFFLIETLVLVASAQLG